MSRQASFAQSLAKCRGCNRCSRPPHGPQSRRLIRTRQSGPRHRGSNNSLESRQSVCNSWCVEASTEEKTACWCPDPSLPTIPSWHVLFGITTPISVEARDRALPLLLSRIHRLGAGAPTFRLRLCGLCDGDGRVHHFQLGTGSVLRKPAGWEPHVVQLIQSHKRQRG